MQQQRRLTEIDFLKGVFITLMIAFHLVWFGDHYPMAKRVVYTFHMPGFLVISGYLLNLRKSNRAILRNIVFWGLPYAVMELCYVAMSSILPIREHIDHLTPVVLADKLFLHPIGPYWYLHTLLICTLIASISHRVGIRLMPEQRAAQGLVILSTSLLMSWLMARMGVLNLYNALYFTAGFTIRTLLPQNVDLFTVIRKTPLWLVPMMLIALDKDNLSRDTLGGAAIVYCIMGSLAYIATKLPQVVTNLVNYLGRNTLPLLLFSPIFTALVKIPQPYLLTIDPTGLVFLVVSVSVCIAGSFGIASLLDRLRISPLFIGREQLLTHLFTAR